MIIDNNENISTTIPTQSICYFLMEYAKNYITKERKAISNIDKKVRDRCLVAAINYLQAERRDSFVVKREALYEEMSEEKIDTRTLMAAVLTYFPEYIFEEDINSIYKGYYDSEIDSYQKIDRNDGVAVLLDFINYVAEENNYRTFTMEELYQEWQKHNYSRKMKKLKWFLRTTDDYGDMLLCKKNNIAEMYKRMARWYQVKYVSRTGKYHSIFEMKSSEPELKKGAFEHDLYAMAYAYAKLVPQSEEEVPFAIKQKIKEMSQK